MCQCLGRLVLYDPIELGLLPVDLVNSALGTELVPAPVRLSAQAHRHIAKDHPEDYEVCIAALSIAIQAPSFIGQAPKHTRNFEIIRRIARTDGRVVLVAISLECERDGCYAVRTSYLLEATKLEARRQKGTVRAIPPR